MGFSVNNSGDISSLFSNLNTSSTTSSSSNYLSDYASIKNGSYGKVLKAYYTKKSNESKASSSTEDKQDTLETMKSAAKDLKAASESLVNKSNLFDEKEITAKDGSKTTGYDYDAIYKKTKEFADAYNTVVKKGGDSNTSSVLRQTLNLVKYTAKNADMLSNVGITINNDNTLSINEDKLKAAQITDLKSLFNGTGSYAYNVSSKASSLDFYVSNAAGAKSAYNATGNYDNTTGKSGSILDNYL